MTRGVARVGVGGGGEAAEESESSESSERSERVGGVVCYESPTSGRTLGPQLSAQCTCFTSTNVQILTRKALLERFCSDSRCSMYLLC